MLLRPLIVVSLAVAAGLAQEPASEASRSAEYTVERGTKIPLSLINTISTKHSAEGDRVYLETSFPVLVNGRIVIPVGSYVAGTVTQIKKPGRMKGRGELYVRFDSLTLPNGVTRDFRARARRRGWPEQRRTRQVRRQSEKRRQQSRRRAHRRRSAPARERRSA